MYFPQSRILEDQSSTGDFQIKSTGETYTGPYCKFSDGRYFTGKTFSNNSQEIVKKIKSVLPITSMPLSALSLTKSIRIGKTLTQQTLTPTTLKPTDDDYRRGIFTRYFASDLTSKLIKIFEININDYTSVNNKDGKFYNIYKVITLEWKITGPQHDDLSKGIYGIEDTNKRVLDIKEKEMPGITVFFGNRLQEFGRPK